jgi:hypothetical protein
MINVMSYKSAALGTLKARIYAIAWIAMAVHPDKYPDIVHALKWASVAIAGLYRRTRSIEQAVSILEARQVGGTFRQEDTVSLDTGGPEGGPLDVPVEDTPLETPEPKYTARLDTTIAVLNAYICSLKLRVIQHLRRIARSVTLSKQDYGVLQRLVTFGPYKGQIKAMGIWELVRLWDHDYPEHDGPTEGC